MCALLFHAVPSGGDGGQCFPAALLPLKHSISLLQNTVNVLTLDVIKTNELLIFLVPQGKVTQPGSDLRVLRHIVKCPALIAVLPTLFSQQRPKAGIAIWLIV